MNSNHRHLLGYTTLNKSFLSLSLPIHKKRHIGLLSPFIGTFSCCSIYLECSLLFLCWTNFYLSSRISFLNLLFKGEVSSFHSPHPWCTLTALTSIVYLKLLWHLSLLLPRLFTIPSLGLYPPTKARTVSILFIIIVLSACLSTKVSNKYSYGRMSKLMHPDTLMPLE